MYLRNALKDRSQHTGAFWIGMLVTVAGLGLFVWSAISENQTDAMKFYLLGLLAWLAIAGLNFVASVFSSAESGK